MLDYEGSRGEFLKLLAEFGEEPAFVRRASIVEESWRQLLRRCCREREELLHWPRTHFCGLKRRVNGNWHRIARLLQDPNRLSFFESFELDFGAVQVVQQMPWTDSGALRAFVDSAIRFDRGWSDFVAQLNLDPINRVRRNYNEYYPIERACAFGTEQFNKAFEPIAMVDRDVLLQRYPLIDVPQLT